MAVVTSDVPATNPETTCKEIIMADKIKIGEDIVVDLTDKSVDECEANISKIGPESIAEEILKNDIEMAVIMTDESEYSSTNDMRKIAMIGDLGKMNNLYILFLPILVPFFRSLVASKD